MAKRSGSYVVPFSFELLSFDEAVGLAADTGRISGDAGPLLETVVDMLDELGRPDEYFDCIQVAGTNGKTSTTRFSAAILRGEGLKTALYTSPQLVRYPERMEVDGRVVSDEAFARGVSAAVEAGHRVNARRVAAGERAYSITPFDLLTAAVESAKELGVKMPVGNLYSSDTFYDAAGRNDRMKKMGVMAVEMEAAGLYCTAAYTGKRALAICSISDNLVNGTELSADERQTTFTNMMKIALEVAVKMAAKK